MATRFTMDPVHRLESRVCPDCKTTLVVEVTHEEYIKYASGAFIAEAFPGMSAGDHERFVSGYCNDCWEKLFADDGEDA